MAKGVSDHEYCVLVVDPSRLLRTICWSISNWIQFKQHIRASFRKCNGNQFEHNFDQFCAALVWEVHTQGGLCCRRTPKPEARTSANACQTRVVRYHHQKLNNKMLKTYPRKSTNLKMTPNSFPQEMKSFQGVAPPEAPLVAQPAYWTLKWVPAVPQMPPMIDKLLKNKHQRAPRLRKIAPKVKPFRGLSWRTARSAYNKSQSIDNLTDSSWLMVHGWGAPWTMNHKPFN